MAGGWAGSITGRKKMIEKEVDKPIEEQSGKKVIITIEHPSEASVSSSASGPAGKKWDDYLQKYVPESEWKSPASHYDEEDTQKVKEDEESKPKGFKKIK